MTIIALKEDSWIKIANSGDYSFIQNQGDSPIALSLSNTTPIDSANSEILYTYNSNKHFSFPLPNNLYAISLNGNGKIYNINYELPNANVNVTSLPSLNSGNNLIGSIISRSSFVSVTPTITANSAYSSGNEVGGLLTFSNVFDSSNSGLLQTVKLTSKSVQTASYKIYLFSQNPSNSTWTNKTNPSISSLDLPFLLGVWIFSLADSGLGTMTTYQIDGISSPVHGNTNNLYGVLVTLDTPTFTSTTDLTIELRILKD